jgi:hypothetical protein
MGLYLWNGKLLVRNGQLATDAACCCGGGDAECPDIGGITWVHSSLVGDLSKVSDPDVGWCPECGVPPFNVPPYAEQFFFGSSGNVAVWFWVEEERTLWEGGPWRCEMAEVHPRQVYHTVYMCCDDGPPCYGSCSGSHTDDCCDETWRPELGMHVLGNGSDEVTFGS